jgi:hypothetical protein
MPGFVFIVSFSLPLLFCCVLIQDGLDFGRSALGFASVWVVVLSFVGSCMASYLFPDAISPEGVYGHGFWGQRQFVRWEDITAVRPLRILSLRWLRVYSRTDNKTTWLGLSHSRAIEYYQEIKRLAPSDSPILNYLK